MVKFLGAIEAPLTLSTSCIHFFFYTTSVISYNGYLLGTKLPISYSFSLNTFPTVFYFHGTSDLDIGNSWQFLNENSRHSASDSSSNWTHMATTFIFYGYQKQMLVSEALLCRYEPKHILTSYRMVNLGSSKRKYL